MRIVSWNIRQGGGSRAPQIIQQIREWQPDVVGFCEFRDTKVSQTIAEAVHKMGLVVQHATINPEAPQDDRLMIAARAPCEVQTTQGVLGSTGRWIHVKVNARRAFDLVLTWVPNRREACTKSVFHKEALEALSLYGHRPAIAMGDTNTGVPDVDEDSNYFTKEEGQWLRDLQVAGWIDVWRQRNLRGREFTWRNNHGKSFRIDQLFATRKMISRVESIKYDWGTPPMGKMNGPSDHAAIVAEITD